MSRDFLQTFFTPKRRPSSLAHDSQQRHVAIDVETTGLSAYKGHRVIEIGAVAIEGGTGVAEFTSLIDAGVAVPRIVQRIHGIDDEMLAGSPLPDEVFPLLEEFIGGGVLVAHNARFDATFLRREFERLGRSFSYRCICTLELSKALYPRLANHRLETVHRHIFGAAPEHGQAHRALHDARMVASIWLAMLGKG
jgi:DNA polymerase III subunit epsilon